MRHEHQWTEVTDAIWARAWDGVTTALPERARDGDRALTALLRAHRRICEGGVAHMIATLDTAELDAACAGYRDHGLGPVAEVLGYAANRLAGEPDDDEAQVVLERALDSAYAALVPDERTLRLAFEAHVRECPDDFAPLDPADDRS